MKHLLLIVDDDEEICTQMKWAFGASFELEFAEDRAAALSAFRRQRFPVVLLDLGLPPRSNEPDEGMKLLGEILRIEPLTRVIVTTAFSDRSCALAAVEAGAYDFFAKPIELDPLRTLLARCFYMASLERDRRKSGGSSGEMDFGGMIGASEAMQDLFRQMSRVAETDAPVLLLGESGTGKEAAAAAIHSKSARKSGPFLTLDCGAIPENLLESELFGHERGAFSGAHAQRAGRIEAAAGGTLFLDGIGELSLPLQVKLLRYLQDKRVRRAGGGETIAVDTRVIAATNADLSRAVLDGVFREDLYYRLAVVVMRFPPLRERGGDLRLLAARFLQRFAAEEQRPELRFTRQAMTAMDRHPWPGNIRELQNRIRRAVILAESERVTPADLELTGGAAGGGPASLREAREEAERETIEETLRRHNGNISSAANALGVSRPTLYEMIGKLGIRRDTL